MKTGPFSLSVLLFALFALFGLAGCDPGRGSAQPPSADSGDRAIVFVPGFYGTALARETDGKRVFITLWEGLFGSTSLGVPWPDLLIQGALPLRPDGILEGVTLVPFLYTIDGYGSAVRFLQDEFGSGASVVTLPYDWRMDLLDAVRELASRVRTLKARGKTRIALVAHSMGGLVVSYYLRYGEQDFSPEAPRETWAGAREVRAAAIAATPFRGSMAVMRNMQEGIPIGLNRAALNAESYSSFASVYAMLPSPETRAVLAPSTRGIPRPDSYSASEAIYSPALWTRQGWGLLRATRASEPVTHRRADFTARQLRRAADFHRAVQAPLGADAPELASIFFVGEGTRTLARAFWTDPHLDGPGEWIFHPKKIPDRFPHLKPGILMEDGDGTVTSASSAIPDALSRGLRAKVVVTKLGHSGMLGNAEIQREITGLLRARGF